MLILALAGAGAALRQSMDSNAMLRANNATLMDVNAQNVESVNALGMEIITRDELVEQARKQQQIADAFRRASDRKLEQLKNENEDLREYFASNMPGGAVYWMWGAEYSGQDGNNQGSATVMAAGADTGAAQPVTHQQGWTWCRDVRDALRSCNDDKAAIREWSEHQK